MFPRPKVPVESRAWWSPWEPIQMRYAFVCWWVMVATAQVGDGRLWDQCPRLRLLPVPTPRPTFVFSIIAWHASG